MSSISKQDREYWLFGLRLVGEFGASIAVPVIIFVIIGQELDKKFATTWVFTVIAFVLSALVSGKIIYRKAKKYGKQYQNLINEESKKEKVK